MYRLHGRPSSEVDGRKYLGFIRPKRTCQAVQERPLRPSLTGCGEVFVGGAVWGHERPRFEAPGMPTTYRASQTKVWAQSTVPSTNVIMQNSQVMKVARAEKSLSQEQLGLLAGVTRQTISSIKTGQYNPSALLALVLARRLDKRGSKNSLFWRTSDEYPPKRRTG